jgi:hypothetical protein
MHNYAPLVISRNEKNKQLTLLSQSKLALTGNVNGYVYSEGHLEKIEKPDAILIQA